jgi:hypothetical protein
MQLRTWTLSSSTSASLYPPYETYADKSLAHIQADDELDKSYLAGFEWDKEESWTRLVVHLQKDAGPRETNKSNKKKKDKGGDDA